MATATAYLKGYQVLPSILNMKPFGHLFIEYFLEGGDEESRIFRAGPRGIHLSVDHSLEHLSRDACRNSFDKGVVTLLRHRINLDTTQNRHTDDKIKFGKLVDFVENLAELVNIKKIKYKVIRDNSNAVAFYVWKLCTNTNPACKIRNSVYNFIGYDDLSIKKDITVHFYPKVEGSDFDLPKFTT